MVIDLDKICNQVKTFYDNNQRLVLWAVVAFFVGIAFGAKAQVPVSR